jgi:hypothetical protein
LNNIPYTLPSTNPVVFVNAINTTMEGIINNRSWWNDTSSTQTVNGIEVDPSIYYKLFTNTTGLVDGNVYGILFNGEGVAVNGFPEFLNSYSENIHIFGSVIQNIKCAINEIPAVATDNGIMNDPVGSVFQTLNKYSNERLTLNDSNKYIGNVISDAQLLVTKYKDMITNLSVSRLSITEELVNSIENDEVLNLTYLLNGDSMFHVNKGLIGIKFDNVVKGYISDTTINNINNEGELGSNINGLYERSHPQQIFKGYNGASTRGITMSSSSNIYLSNLNVSNIISKRSLSHGIDILYESSDISLMDIEIDQVKSSYTNNHIYQYNNNPTHLPESIGIVIDSNVKRLIIMSCNITNIISTPQYFRTCLRDKRETIIIRN